MTRDAALVVAVAFGLFLVYRGWRGVRVALNDEDAELVTWVAGGVVSLAIAIVGALLAAAAALLLAGVLAG
jgi:hypothetical protein